MPTTIKDVAKKLNLSIASVSRALDGYPDISEETRQKVIKTAREMGYIPNRAARQLRRKRADAIGFILPAQSPRFSDPFYSEFLAGLCDECGLYPFDLLISIAHPGEDSEQDIYTNWTLSRKVDGFILNHLRKHDWRIHYLIEHDIPFSTFGHNQDSINALQVDVNDISSMIGIINHLIDLGHKEIAFIGGPAYLSIQINRLEGFFQGLRQSGLEIHPEWVLNSDLTSQGGYEALQQLWLLKNKPQAIVCINDESAFGVMHGLKDLGIKPGQDIAVVGFDGVQLSEHSDPPLTTQDIPVYTIARHLVRLLAETLSGNEPVEKQIIVEPELRIRASTIGI